MQVALHLERRDALGVEARRTDLQIQLGRLAAAAVQIPGHQFDDELIAGNRLHLQQVEAIAHLERFRLLLGQRDRPRRAARLRDHEADIGQAQIVLRRAKDLNHVVGLDDQVLRRLLDHHGGNQIRQGINFVKGAVLIVEARLFGNQVHLVSSRAVHGYANAEFRGRSGDQDVRQFASPQLKVKLAVGNRLIDLHLEIHHGFIQRFEIAIFINHRFRLEFGVGRIMINLLKGLHVRTGPGLDAIFTRDRGVGSEAILDGLGVGGNGSGILALADQCHGDFLMVAALALMKCFQHDAGGNFARNFDQHGNVVAGWHEALGLRRLENLDLDVRDAFDIGHGNHHPRDQLRKSQTREDEQNREHHDRAHRAKQPTRNQTPRQQLIGVHALHPGGDVGLEQIPKSLRIPIVLFLVLAQLDGRDQILAQIRTGLLDDARHVAGIGRLEQEAQTAPPKHAESGEIGDRAEGVAQEIGQDDEPVDDGDDRHAGEERDQPFGEAAHQNQPAPTQAEFLQLFGNKGIE